MIITIDQEGWSPILDPYRGPSNLGDHPKVLDILLL